jgi:hypothetical protein
MAAIRKKQTAPTVQCTAFVAAFKALSGLYEEAAFGNRNALQFTVASDTLAIGPLAFRYCIDHLPGNIPGRCPARILLGDT